MTAMPVPPAAVTFDLFSALLDSRAGATAALARIGAGRRWSVDPAELHDRWDAANKAAQRAAGQDAPERWASWRSLATGALEAVYAELGVDGDAAADAGTLLASAAGWPLWPDVAADLPALARRHRVGLLSNVDDDVALRTRAAALVEPDLVLTSQRLRAYKPTPRMYREAARAVGGPGALVHVASSARDVRGALEAGIAVVRLRRPGHRLDPDGPRPAYEADGIAALARLVPQVVAEMGR